MNRPCPICSSIHKKLLYTQDFHNNELALMRKYSVVACVKCGFVFADKIPGQGKFSTYYSIMSKYEYNSKGGVVSGDQLSYFTKVVDYIVPYLSGKKVSILDVGCSTGSLLSVFKKKGFKNIRGLDPSLYCVKSVRRLYKIKAVKANISSYKTKNKYDLIILSATLEHLADFNSSMAKIRGLLKDNGLLFIEVPDAERFSAFISAPFQQFSIEHINYFSKYSMVNLLSRYSFRKINISRNINKFNRTTDPDLFVLAEKVPVSRNRISKDTVSKTKIRVYIGKCHDLDKKLKDRLAKIFHENKRIIVWGAGTSTQRLLGNGIDLSKTACFVDSNKRYSGKELDGIKIRSPKNIKEQDIPILISTYAYQEEIAYQIRNVLKLKNRIIKIYEKNEK